MTPSSAASASRARSGERVRRTLAGLRSTARRAASRLTSWGEDVPFKCDPISLDRLGSDASGGAALVGLEPRRGIRAKCHSRVDRGRRGIRSEPCPQVPRFSERAGVSLNDLASYADADRVRTSASIDAGLFLDSAPRLCRHLFDYFIQGCSGSSVAGLGTTPS